MYALHIPYISLETKFIQILKNKEIHTNLSHTVFHVHFIALGQPQLLHGGTTFPRAPWSPKKGETTKEHNTEGESNRGEHNRGDGNNREGEYNKGTKRMRTTQQEPKSENTTEQEKNIGKEADTST